MNTLSVKGAAPRPSAADLQRWRNRLEKLLSEIARWTKESKWPLGEQTKEIEEAAGSYPARVLNIKTPQGILIVEPIAQDVVGTQGRVDVYSFPTLNRVRLLWTGRKWVVRTDSNIDLKGEWSKRMFVELARDLTAN